MEKLTAFLFQISNVIPVTQREMKDHVSILIVLVIPGAANSINAGFETFSLLDDRLKYNFASRSYSHNRILQSSAFDDELVVELFGRN